MKTVLRLIAGLLAGTAGSMGLGGGSILLIYLAVFEKTNQMTAQGINLFFFLPIAFVAVIIYSVRREIEWKQILPIIISGVAGALAASYFVAFINVNLLRKLFGIAILIYGLIEVLGKKEKGIQKNKA